MYSHSCPLKEQYYLHGGWLLQNVYENARKAIAGPRLSLRSDYQKTLDRFKDFKIISMNVCRDPLKKVIDKALNFISLGQWEKNKKKYSYDDLFHLFLLIKVEKNGVISNIHMEKNEVIKIVQYPNTECQEFMPIHNIPKNLTLGQFYENGFKFVTGNNNLQKWFVYDPVKANCQVFVMDLLSGNNMNYPELTNFISQCSECVMNGYLYKIGKGVTDFAGRVDVLLHGGRMSKCRLCNNIKGGNCSYCNGNGFFTPIYSGIPKSFRGLVPRQIQPILNKNYV